MNLHIIIMLCVSAAAADMFPVNIHTCDYQVTESLLRCKAKETGEYLPDRLLNGIVGLEFEIKTGKKVKVSFLNLLPDLTSVKLIGNCRNVEIEQRRDVDVECHSVIYSLSNK